MVPINLVLDLQQRKRDVASRQREPNTEQVSGLRRKRMHDSVEKTLFLSLEDNGPGNPSTTLDGYMFLPTGSGRYSALVFCMAVTVCSIEPPA
jgi:hypothetical protein